MSRDFANGPRNRTRKTVMLAQAVSLHDLPPIVPIFSPPWLEGARRCQKSESEQGRSCGEGCRGGGDAARARPRLLVSLQSLKVAVLVWAFALVRWRLEKLFEVHVVRDHIIQLIVPMPGSPA